MEACARAACHFIHFLPVLEGPPSLHPTTLAHPHFLEMPNQPAAATRHVVGLLASRTHEAPSLRESGEQDQHQGNEPHVHTATANANGLHSTGNKSHLSLSQQTLVGHKV